jgi:hypothetical protein
VSKLRPWALPFLILMGVYTVAMLSIWRGGVSHLDDLGRAIDGHSLKGNFQRYSASYLLSLLNTNTTLFDISPWPQIVAMALLSIAGIAVVWLLCGHQVRYLPVVLAAFIGLSPLSLENWLYKFDSAGMALAVLAAIVPFLCWRRAGTSRRGWAVLLVVCAAGVFVTLTSYQVGTGAFVVMLLAMMLLDFLDGQRARLVFKRAACATLGFAVACVLFNLLPKHGGVYRPAAMLPVRRLVSGAVSNAAGFVEYAYYQLTFQWKALICLAVVCFLAGVLTQSKRRGASKIFDGLAALAFVVLAVSLSQGVYLLLSRPQFNARSNLGIGVAMAVAAILTVRGAKPPGVRWLAAPAAVLLYSFAVFALAFGNAQVDQQRYGLYRTEELLSDLSRLYPESGRVAARLQMQGTVHYGPVMRQLESKYHIVREIRSQTWLGDVSWWDHVTMIKYYDFAQTYVSPAKDRWDVADFELVLATRDHDIYEDAADSRILVLLK